MEYTDTVEPDKYPVLVLGKFSYWSLNYIGNQTEMAVLASDSNYRIVGLWRKTGVHHVNDIEWHEGNGQIEFVGQGEPGWAFFPLAELKAPGRKQTEFATV